MSARKHTDDAGKPGGGSEHNTGHLPSPRRTGADVIEDIHQRYSGIIGSTAREDVTQTAIQDDLFADIVKRRQT